MNIISTIIIAIALFAVGTILMNTYLKLDIFALFVFGAFLRAMSFPVLMAGVLWNEISDLKTFIVVIGTITFCVIAATVGMYTSAAALNRLSSHFWVLIGLIVTVITSIVAVIGLLWSVQLVM